MRTCNSYKKSLSLREFSVRVLWVFLLIGCLVSPAAAVEFWDITIVDSVGQYTSLAILPSEQPAISYYDSTNQDLKYAWYDGSAWQTEVVDSAGAVGTHTSLTILPSGHPAISYYDNTNDDLKFAGYDGSTWQMATVDSTGNVGRYTSLAILPSGQPSISYYYDGTLKYAWYDGSTWQTTTVDSGSVGMYTSLAILPSGHPAISYYDNTNRDLKYAWYDGSTWQMATVDSAGSVGLFSSLAILPSSQPAISYFDDTNNYLKYAWYDGGAWQLATVDSAGVGWSGTSLAILPSGNPAISYLSSTNLYCLKYAWYDGSTWQNIVLDSYGTVGFNSSLAILPSGQPAISYSDATNTDLKFATPADVPQAPLAMGVNYTATAHTDLGGTTVVDNGPAYNQGWGHGTNPARASSSVGLETTDGGHLRGGTELVSHDGLNCLFGSCVGWDPQTGECIIWNCFVEWEDTSCGDANGTISGTIVLGTSQSYPVGSDLDLALEVLVDGDPGDFEDYYLKVWRGVSLLGQIDPSAPDGIVVAVEAGETLTFELFASEEDWAGDTEEYDRGFEFRMILRGPANLDGIGSVDFREFAIFALHWLETGCVEPTWCGKTDFNKTGDVGLPDLKIFAGHWQE